MKVGLISDAHGHLANLESVVNALDRKVDRFVFAGDAFSEYKFSNEVVALLRQKQVDYILGNHEQSFLSDLGQRARQSPGVDQELVQYVRERPQTMRMCFDGTRVLVVHASPWPPYTQYLVPGSRELSRCSELECDVLVLGHSHSAFVLETSTTVVVNPGSAGVPSAEGEVSGAILDTSSRSVAHVRVPASS